jgi:hypothetical protein
LNELEHNKEFSHTILHNFHVFKNPKSEILERLSNKDQINTRESINNLISNKNANIKDNYYNKPVIKKDNVPLQNNKLKKNNYNNYVSNNKDEKEIVNVILMNNKEKEREKELENINLLKRNLMVKETNQLNHNIINTNISNNNFNFNEKKQNQIPINPINISLENYLQIPGSKPKLRCSTEIETNKILKNEKMPSLESKNSDKKIDKKNESPVKVNEIKRNNNLIINLKKDNPMLNNLLVNKEKEKEAYIGKKSTENTTVNSDKENVQVSNSDRKRSESRGSEEGREKNLKDFMKNMKEKVLYIT